MTWFVLAMALAGGGTGTPVPAEPVRTDPWNLDFRFHTPRLMMVDLPGQGRKPVWYMVYQVANRTNKPRRFVPEFLFVTDKGVEHRDVVLPSVEKLVSAREDPTRKLANSVTISAPLAPMSESGPGTQSGVVFWQEVDLDTQSATIYVKGLSSLVMRKPDSTTQKESVLVRTLELRFSKPGSADEQIFRYTGEPVWSYR